MTLLEEALLNYGRANSAVAAAARDLREAIYAAPPAAIRAFAKQLEQRAAEAVEAARQVAAHKPDEAK